MPGESAGAGRVVVINGAANNGVSRLGTHGADANLRAVRESQQVEIHWEPLPQRDVAVLSIASPKAIDLQTPPLWKVAGFLFFAASPSVMFRTVTGAECNRV